MEQFISGLVQKKLSQKMIKEMLHSKEIFLNATLLRFFFSIFFNFWFITKIFKVRYLLSPQKMKFPHLIIYLFITKKTKSIHYNSIYISVNNSLFLPPAVYHWNRLYCHVMPPEVPNPNIFPLWKGDNCDQGQVLSRTAHTPLLKQVSHFPLTLPDTHPIM